MPRQPMEGTSPHRIRIPNADNDRVKELFKFTGTHGQLSSLVRRGLRIQLYIEEVARGRITPTETVRTAIHTLQDAVDRRASGNNGQGKEPQASRGAKKKASSSTNTKDKNNKSRDKGKGSKAGSTTKIGS